VSLAIAIASCCATQLRADTYPGNGGTSFGGPLGTGSITLTDNGTTISGTFTRGSGNHNDILVLYIDSVAGGFSTTSGFNDQADDLRRGISGVGGFGRSTVNFASGFQADYAIAIHNNNFTFGGLWSLANGNNNSLNFIDSVNLSGGGSSAASFTFDFNWSEVGLGSPGSFNWVATYLSESGFRSNEAIGASDAPGGNIGSGTLNYSGFVTYPIPEPSSAALLVIGATALLVLRRIRK
jgi:hypothetical protein